MSDNIIEVRGLGKKYIINHQQERYSALRDVMVNKIKNLGKKKLDTGEQEEFWALTDVSFDIKPGDKVGIIGRNGAGKSTLLKLLSRITEPTTGSIKINGRVASLLEVGTGFHPELTGRENIFLNGAILGMSKQEIKKKFDEIVEFAEVEKFLDNPVKRYSSGMYVRLAFSVAAHLEPEILIVDEVLAVGDAQFQKKCLGKMGDVSKEGRTVLFVSHNMGAIQQLCEKGILLNKGNLCCYDGIKAVMSKYTTESIEAPSVVDLTNYRNAYGNNEIEVIQINLINSINNSFSICWDDHLEISILIKVNKKISGVCFNIGCTSIEQTPLFITSCSDNNQVFGFETGTYVINSKIYQNLKPGKYILSLSITSGTAYYYRNTSAATVEVSSVSKNRDYTYDDYGYVYLNSEWEEKQYNGNL